MLFGLADMVVVIGLYWNQVGFVRVLLALMLGLLTLLFILSVAFLSIFRGSFVCVIDVVLLGQEE